MPGIFSSLAGYLYKWVYPPPPPPAPDPNTLYCYRWQAGAGVPNPLQQVVPSAAGAGIYVGFIGVQLEALTDPFGRDAGGPGPVFAANVPATQAVTNMVTQVAVNPPANQDGWRHPAPGRIADLGGFLAYVALCLDLVDHTADGHTALTRIGATGRAVFILPNGQNQTSSGGQNRAVDALTEAVRAYAAGGPVPDTLILAAVAARYAAIVGTPARFAQLAADMNNAPLYTLFQTAVAAPPTYLLHNFAYHGAPLDGADLMAWVGPGGAPAFDAAVRGMTVPNADGVKMREAFLLALCVALRAAAAPGLGTDPTISFNTQNVGDNVLGSPDFRPPAIGLAHELMHAMHYAAGTAAGYEQYHFTTTTAELLFTGIGPSATDLITENAIRAQWPPVGIVPDASNTWAAPVQRPVYEAPAVGTTLAQIRASNNCP